MGFQIEGADGLVASVIKTDGENRLATAAVSEAYDRYYNKQGLSYSVTYEGLTPTGANDYFFYLKNTGIKNINFTNLRISSTVATRITIEKVTGTAAGGSTLASLNRNFGSSKALTATIEQGVDITGLTTGGVMFFEECATASTRYKLSTTSNLIIPQGQAIALKRVAATGALTFTMSFVEEVI